MQISEAVALLVLGGACTTWVLFAVWGISWRRETREYRETLTKFKRQLQREYDADFTLAETASILLNYGLAEPHLGERNDYEWVPEVVADAYERLKGVEQRGAVPAAEPTCGCASCVPPGTARPEPASQRVNDCPDCGKPGVHSHNMWRCAACEVSWALLPPHERPQAPPEAQPEPSATHKLINLVAAHSARYPGLRLWQYVDSSGVKMNLKWSDGLQRPRLGEVWLREVASAEALPALYDEAAEQLLEQVSIVLSPGGLKAQLAAAETTPEEPASLRTRLDQFERAAVAYDIQRRPGAVGDFSVFNETSQALAKAENGLLGASRTIGMPEMQWRPWVDALRKACETYARAEKGHLMDGALADIARIKTRIIELHEREWLKAQDPQVFALLAEYRAAAIGATFASPGMRQTELAVAEADLYDKLVALVASKPAAPTVVSLTFAELRAVNLRRCPLFRNAKGVLCHPGGIWSHDPDFWVTALVGEIGEAANFIKKVDRGDFTLDEMRDEIGKELADAQTYLDILAARLDISLEKATISKFNEVSRRIGCDVFLGDTA